MNILLAGRDTTAGTLSWAFYELAAYPEKWARLREEVLSTNMRYLRYTLNETLRLYPALPYNTRAALNGTTLPGGPGRSDIAILKGGAVAYSLYLMPRRRELYPPVTAEFADPLIFSPERWYNWQPQAWDFVPFNGGPRIVMRGTEFCHDGDGLFQYVSIYSQFAALDQARQIEYWMQLANARYAVVCILQRYERLGYRGDWEAQRHKADIVARPSLGVPVALFEAVGGREGE
ncbi:cytochrome P450 [Apiospora aurea]|uniref:Cytochrome P450 n=1 Tax=Apiospora aurea TaxID=335848 RepID=A0ABR1Q6Z8_9PEZI